MIKMAILSLIVLNSIGRSYEPTISVKETAKEIKFITRHDILKEFERAKEEKAKEELEKQKKLQLEEQKKKHEKQMITLDYYDLRVKSNVSVESLNDYLESNTSLGAIAEAYVQAEADYGVNAIYLLAITLEESGRGTSNLRYSHNNISGTRIRTEEGYSYKYFESLWDCIHYTARNLSNNYLNTEGMYHNGYSLYDVNTKYCFQSDNETVDRQWAVKVQALAEEIYYYVKE